MACACRCGHTGGGVGGMSTCACHARHMGMPCVQQKRTVSALSRLTSAHALGGAHAHAVRGDHSHAMRGAHLHAMRGTEPPKG
eukprot:50335-Chlamydomonas_euryale.AAC.5